MAKNTKTASSKESSALQVLYTIFLGVLIALFVGVGIATFYEAPPVPEYPQLATPESDKETATYERQTAEYDKKYEAYQRDYEIYNRNVSIVALVAAVTFIVVGLVFEKRIRLLASATALGGIFTLLYSIGRGFAADDNRYVFIVLAVSLVLIFYLGYRQFVRPNKA